MMKTLTLAATTLAMIGGAVLPATAADSRGGHQQCCSENQDPCPPHPQRFPPLDILWPHTRHTMRHLRDVRRGMHHTQASTRPLASYPLPLLQEPLPSTGNTKPL